MRIKFSMLIIVAVAVSAGFAGCKAKKGAGSANVRTLSLKAPGMYTLSLGTKNMADASSFTTKELAAADKVKIMSQGKEVTNASIKFKVRITKDDIDTGAAENDGTELSVQVAELLKGAASGDKIYFESIRITPQGGEAMAYPPMSFSVK